MCTFSHRSVLRTCTCMHVQYTDTLAPVHILRFIAKHTTEIHATYAGTCTLKSTDKYTQRSVHMDMDSHTCSYRQLHSVHSQVPIHTFTCVLQFIN